MATETCAVCGEQFPFDRTVHLLVHTNTEEGALDYYVCRQCYEREFASLLE